MRSHRCGGGCAEGGPLPVVVLRVEQEVGAHNGHAHRDDRQNDEHQQHEAVHIVHLQQAGQRTQACQPLFRVSVPAWGQRTNLLRCSQIRSQHPCSVLCQRQIVATHSQTAGCHLL